MMVKLNKSLTKIEVEEQAVEDFGLTAAVPERLPRYWTADLDGVSTQGESVRMSRNGKTPDEALRNLFEAMGDAGVAL